ncbi:ATP-grasp domain-containing protein [Jatrophihabitans sp.]|uniref:ATP-grasp domain-containing protein n=1 Tax=Jatrophihabitans sp. TaxID=1932789 RepID=UPI002D04FA7B|nr:ATP-grasp domain-containing protein [Jatrophihabitans sp.]
MATIVVLESLTFGLSRLAEAVRSRGHDLVLLARDPDWYWYELEVEIPRRGLAPVPVRVCETFDRDEVLREIATLADVRGLIANTDTWGLAGAEIAAALGLPTRDPRLFCDLRNKTRVRNSLYSKELSPAPASELAASAVTAGQLQELIASAPSGHIIVKDAAGTGSENVWLATSGTAASVATEVSAAARNGRLRSQTVTCEPYFEGELFSAETVSFEGEHRFLAVSGRITSSFPGFRENAAVTPVSTTGRLAGVEEWVSRVLTAVGYDTGFAHTEFVVGPDGFEVIEVNPRLGGVTIGEALSRALQVNIYDALVDIALGERPRLMDLEAAPRSCVAQWVLYPDRAGEFVSVRDRLSGAPLATGEWFPTKRVGVQLPDPVDQRASVGMLVVEEASADLAILRMLSRQNAVEVVVA